MKIYQHEKRGIIEQEKDERREKGLPLTECPEPLREAAHITTEQMRILDADIAAGARRKRIAAQACIVNELNGRLLALIEHETQPGDYMDLCVRYMQAIACIAPKGGAGRTNRRIRKAVERVNAEEKAKENDS